MSKTVAVLAEEGLQLDALLEAWEASELLQPHTPLLLSADAGGNTALFRNRPLAFHAIDEVSAADIQLLLVLSADKESRQWLQTLNCPVLGDGSVLAGTGAQLFRAQREGLLQVPQAVTLALQSVLQDVVCHKLSASVLVPASAFGKRGVDELAAQTVKLLNAQAISNKVFDRQLTFNSFPFADTAAGERLAQEWRDLLHVEDAYAALLQVPVFHGIAVQLSLELADEQAVSRLQQQWQTSAHIVLPDEPEDCSVMAAVLLDGLIQLANIQTHAVNPRRLDLWMAFDDVQLSVRQGLVCAAEFLLKHDL